MGRIGVDLSTANLTKAGMHVGTVLKLEYQIKTGEKWNNEGTTSVPFDEFNASQAPDNMKRLRYTIAVPKEGNHWNDLYMHALGFAQGFMNACGVEYNASGFDPDDAVGKQMNVEAEVSETEEFGFQNNFKYSKI